MHDDDLPLLPALEVGNPLTTPVRIQDLEPEVLVEGILRIQTAMIGMLAEAEDDGTPRRITFRGIARASGIHPLQLTRLLRENQSLQRLFDEVRETTAHEAEDALAAAALDDESADEDGKLIPGISPGRAKALQTLLAARNRAYQSAPSSVTQIYHHEGDVQINGVEDARNYFLGLHMRKREGKR